jgi:hypothetical protein
MVFRIVVGVVAGVVDRVVDRVVAGGDEVYSTTLLPGSSLEDTRRKLRGGATSIRMKNSLLSLF